MEGEQVLLSRRKFKPDTPIEPFDTDGNALASYDGTLVLSPVLTSKMICSNEIGQVGAL